MINRCIPLLFLFVMGLAHGEPGTLSGGPSAPHSVEEETAAIRQHHLKRLSDRLTLEPGVLKENCRYESEISTRPPARRVVLTFDDGPEPGQTELILQVLKKHDIKGAFFLIGKKVEQYPKLVEEIRAGGHHVVGNHSWDHPNFHDIGVADQINEVSKTKDLWPDAASIKLFRYPYGNSTCETNDFLHTNHYRIVGWHVDSCDWAFDRTGTVDAKEALSCGVLPQNRSDFVEHVVSAVRAHNGGIVLFHEIHPNTVKRLDEIVVRLLREGFTFGTLDEEGFAPSLR